MFVFHTLIALISLLAGSSVIFQDARRRGAVPLPLTSVSTTLQLSGDVLSRLPMLQRCSVAEQLLRAVRAGAADDDVRGGSRFIICVEFFRVRSAGADFHLFCFTFRFGI